MCTGREDEKPKGGKVCRSVFKFLVAVSVTAGLAICVYTCFQFYYDFPTYTDISVVNQEEALFPAVTFCPEFPEKIKEEVLRVFMAQPSLGFGHMTLEKPENLMRHWATPKVLPPTRDSQTMWP